LLFLPDNAFRPSLSSLRIFMAVSCATVASTAASRAFVFTADALTFLSVVSVVTSIKRYRSFHMVAASGFYNQKAYS
jgi:hypothetical protein